MTYFLTTTSKILESDDPLFRNGAHFGKNYECSFEIAVHDTLSDKIIINYPGANGSLHGYNDKYAQIGNFLQDSNVGAVVRANNLILQGFRYDQLTQNRLRAVIEYSIENASDICGTDDPEIYLMGFSAGASAIAAVAHEYPNISKRLLIAPSMDAGTEDIIYGLQQFDGETYITFGEDDPIAFSCIKAYIYGMDLPEDVLLDRIKVVPNCDHEFRGKINGMVLSKAAIWAFANDKTYPSPEGGITLYD